MRKNLGSSGPLFLKVAPPLPRPPPLAPRPPPLPPFHTDKTRTLEREHRHSRHLPRPPLKPPPPLSLPPPLPSPRPPLPLLPPPPRPRSSILNLKLEIITNSRKSQIMIRDFHCLSRSRPYRTEPAGSRKTLWTLGVLRGTANWGNSGNPGWKRLTNAEPMSSVVLDNIKSINIPALVKVATILASLSEVTPTATFLPPSKGSWTTRAEWRPNWNVHVCMLWGEQEAFFSISRRKYNISYSISQIMARQEFHTLSLSFLPRRNLYLISEIYHTIFVTFLSDPSPIIGYACHSLTHWLTDWLTHCCLVDSMAANDTIC